MKILALDAATEACSAALLVDAALTERFEVIGRGHADRLLPMADELLRSAGLDLRVLDAIAFGRGPGGFTGIRIAAGLAQGLASGGGHPILPVSNLAAVAAGAAREVRATRILACMDARMGEVYWAAFDVAAGVPIAASGEHLTEPGSVEPPQGAAWFGAGHGFAAYPEIAARLGDRLAVADGARLPRASDIARIAASDLAAGKGLPAAGGLPVYLRNEVVHRR
jgi:tRNA threonylcarbamoyladenosine biosynthesis protein TsaB